MRILLLHLEVEPRLKSDWPPEALGVTSGCRVSNVWDMTSAAVEFITFEGQTAPRVTFELIFLFSSRSVGQVSAQRRV